MRKAQKEQVEELLKLLEQAHEEIKRNIEKRNFEPVLVTLADCQDCAVAMGNLIEESEGENFVTISFLEKYCEAVYQIYQSIANGENIDVNKTEKSLRKGLIAAENSIRNDIKIRKEVVFFPYKASMWDSLESVYLAAKADPDCDAYCVPIPYFDKNPDGTVKEMHYEGREYPANIEIIDWQSYNFEERKPDVIYIHNPYDQFNYVTSVHPRFYASNLQKYTNELVYIPYFVLTEIEPDDQAAIEGMKHFCYLPGTIYADKVILQSENMRQIYINEYMKACKRLDDQELRKDLEKRFLGTGSPKFDKVLNTKREDLEIPEDWLKIIEKPDGSLKKIIFYNTSIGALLQHDEKMLEKMKSVFATFKENKDEVALLWRPHPLIQATIESMRPQLWAQYKEIVEQYKAEGWGIYDDSADLDRAVVLSDAYYGDWSSVVHLCQKAEMPVMVQNIDCQSDLMKLNIEDAKIINNKIWMITAQGDYLYGLNILTDEIDIYEMPVDIKEIGNYRAIEVIENNLYLIPSKSCDLLSFNLCTKEFKVIKLKGNGFFATTRYQNYLFIFGVFEPIVNRININDDSVECIENVLTYPIEIFDLRDSFFRRQVAIVENKLYVPFCNANAVLELEPIGMQYRIYSLGKEKEGYSGICHEDGVFWLSPRKYGCVVKWNKEINQIERIKGNLTTREQRLSYLGIVISENKKVMASMYNINEHFETVSDIVELRGEYHFLNVEDDKLIAYEHCHGNLEVYSKDVSLLWKKKIRFSRNMISNNLRNIDKEEINFEGAKGDLFSLIEWMIP